MLLRYLILCACALPLLACSTSEPAMTAPLAPPAGKILFIVGQDVLSIEDYVRATGVEPGGFTGYTSLDKLEGVTRAASYGSGPHHLDRLAKIYPHSAIALGLDLVGYLPALPSGLADHKIDLLLDHFARYDRPIFLRFGYEFDGEWNHYPPDEYVAAWKYFRQKLEEKGLDNVAMVWQSATFCGGTYLDEPITAWYPGDDDVDWIGLSYFTQSDCDFAPMQALLDFARERGKPVMIAESTPQRYDVQNLTYSADGKNYAARSAEAIWNEWYAPYFAFIHDNAGVIRAVAYINARWDDQPMWGPPYSSGYWGDSRIQANDLIEQRWLDEIGGTLWLHASPDLFDTLNR